MGDGNTVVAGLRWVLTTDQWAIAFCRELVSSTAAVAVVGLVLFAVSGVWPPMVAVESGSMEPVMERGDLVFIMDEDRLPPAAAREDRGVVPYEQGERIDYRSFGTYGDVIVYDPPNRAGPPIIHRAMFWVDEGENWYPKADSSFVAGVDSCEELQHCPAPNPGFITKGDANPTYDQVQGLAPPVRPAWITGTGKVRVQGLGLVRLCWRNIGACLARA
jgi:signal peptidase